MEHINQALRGIGMNEKEISIYLTLLNIGMAPGSTIAQRTSIPRSTVQFIGKELAKRGIITMTRKNNVHYFTPEPPEKLLYLLERDQKSIEKRQQEMLKVMGPLKQMMNPLSALPKVEYYEGEEGMIRLYDSFLDMRAPIDSFEETGKVFELFPEYAQEYMRKRIEWKIPNRCIAPSGSPGNTNDPERFIEARFLDPKKYPFTWHIKMCGDTVGIFSFDDRASVGIGIRHHDIAKNFHLLFQYVWDSLKK